MKNSKSPAGPAGTIILVACLFVAVLAVSIGVQLFTSSDFKGFGSEPPPGEPEVTYLTGEATGAEAPKTEAPYDWQDHPVFIVGDSLTQGARKDIANAVPGATIDGKVNRNMTEGLKIIMDWDDAGILKDDAIIVVCLAHNITGGTRNDAEQIVDMIRPGQSLIMMTGHGHSDMGPINEYIRGLPYAYSYITAADWDMTIAQSPGLLSDDGVHISGKQGNEVYAELILRALEATKPMP